MSLKERGEKSGRGEAREACKDFPALTEGASSLSRRLVSLRIWGRTEGDGIDLINLRLS
jgi:hypothetical protein